MAERGGIEQRLQSILPRYEAQRVEIAGMVNGLAQIYCHEHIPVRQYFEGLANMLTGRDIRLPFSKSTVAELARFQWDDLLPQLIGQCILQPSEFLITATEALQGRQNLDSVYLRSWLDMQNDDLESAEARLSESMMRYGRDKEFHFLQLLMAELKILKGEHAEARRWLRKVNTGPYFPRVGIDATFAHYLSGNLDMAEHNVQIAMQWPLHYRDIAFYDLGNVIAQDRNDISTAIQFRKLRDMLPDDYFVSQTSHKLRSLLGDRPRYIEEDVDMVPGTVVYFHDIPSGRLMQLHMTHLAFPFDMGPHRIRYVNPELCYYSRIANESMRTEDRGKLYHGTYSDKQDFTSFYSRLLQQANPELVDPNIVRRIAFHRSQDSSYTFGGFLYMPITDFGVDANNEAIREMDRLLGIEPMQFLFPPDDLEPA